MRDLSPQPSASASAPHAPHAHPAAAGCSPPNLAARPSKAPPRPQQAHAHAADAIFAAGNAPLLPGKEHSPSRLKKSSGGLPPPTPMAGVKGEKFGILADLEGTVYSSRLSVMVKDAGGGRGGGSKRFLEKPEGYLGGAQPATMSVMGLMQKAKSLQSELHRIGVIDMSGELARRSRCNYLFNHHHHNHHHNHHHRRRRRLRSFNF